METRKPIPAPFTKGVNFTTWLEYRPADEINAEYIVRQDFVNARKLGCDVIRLPIHFEKLCSEADGFKIPEKILQILDNAVHWSEEQGMYLILDFHNDCSADSKTPDDVDKILIPVWTELASRYKDYPDCVVYEIMNEPHAIDIALWNKIILDVFNRIRAIDKNHWIIVGGADWNSTAAMKTLPDFNDSKVIYNFHYYDPHLFTHQGASWTHIGRIHDIPFPYDKDKMPPLPQNPTDEEVHIFESYAVNGRLETVTNYFDQYADFSHERNAPVFCGEFGCFKSVPNDMRVNWYRIVAGLLAERGIARTSWDYYGGFGIFNEESGKKPRFPEDLNRPLLAALGLNTDL